MTDELKSKPVLPLQSKKRNLQDPSLFMNCTKCDLRIPITLERKHWKAWHSK